MATQDVFLFSDSVDGNIAYGDSQMSEEDVMGVNILFPSTFDIAFDNYTKIIDWKEFLYMRLLYAVTVDALYFPSQELLDMYDKEHDLRYRYHVVEGVMSTMYASSVDYPIYTFFTLTDLPSGPTTAESRPFSSVTSSISSSAIVSTAASSV